MTREIEASETDGGRGGRVNREAAGGQQARGRHGSGSAPPAMAPKKKTKTENGAKVTDSGEDGGARWPRGGRAGVP